MCVKTAAAALCDLCVLVVVRGAACAGLQEVMQEAERVAGCSSELDVCTAKYGFLFEMNSGMLTFVSACSRRPERCLSTCNGVPG